MLIDWKNVHEEAPKLRKFIAPKNTEDAIKKLEDLLTQLRNGELVVYEPGNRYPGSGVWVDEDHEIITISMSVPKRK
jgi:hypothetical protein